MGGVLGFCVSFWNLLTGHRGGRGLPGLPARDAEAAAGAGGFASVESRSKWLQPAKDSCWALGA